MKLEVESSPGPFVPDRMTFLPQDFKTAEAWFLLAEIPFAFKLRALLCERSLIPFVFPLKVPLRQPRTLILTKPFAKVFPAFQNCVSLFLAPLAD